MSAAWDEVADYVARRRDELYGRDLFLPLRPEFDFALLDRWLSDTFGFRIDRLSAEYYRRAYTSLEWQLREEGEA